MTSARLRCGHLKILARIGGAALMLAIASGTPALARNPLKLPETQYEPVAWAMIDGWADDDHNAAFASFLNSCKAILQGPPSRNGQPMVGALFKVCQRAVEAEPRIATSGRPGTGPGVLPGPYPSTVTNGARRRSPAGTRCPDRPA